MTHLAIPETLPVMTLPETVLFPQAMMPLYIFESRYRQMLADVLDGHRLFAIASVDSHSKDQFEPPCRIATVGIIRACHKNDDGTANLIIQGLARIHFEEIVTEEPYRMVRVRALPTQEKEPLTSLEKLKSSLLAVIRAHHNLGAPQSTEEVVQFLANLEDPETLLDLSAFTLCEDPEEKQLLLETLDLSERFQEMLSYLRAENERIQLENKLKGNMDEDDISLN